MNVDDPRLTAYALDELPDDNKPEVEEFLRRSPDARQFVAETRDFAGLLTAEFHRQPLVEETKPLNISDIRDDPWFWSVARPLAIAAVMALLGLIAALIIAPYRLGQAPQNGMVNLPTATRPDSSASYADVDAQESASPGATIPEMQEADRVVVAGSQIPTAEEVGPNPEPVRRRGAKSKNDNGEVAQPAPPLSSANAVGGIVSLQPTIERSPSQSEKSFEWDSQGNAGHFNTAAYGHIVENPFLDAASNPLSTFSIDVDTASYSNIRRFINSGSLPPADAVRIEEMINYFSYDYPQPADGRPFSINLDVATCPWEPAHRLVRIGLKGRDVASDQRGESNLVFLLDVSGSMTPPQRLPLVKQAMRLLVQKLTPNDRVAIVVYAGESGLVLPSTTGDHKDKILSAIDGLQPGGSTNGAEGIQLAYQIAAANFIKGGVNRVILATDGDFNVGVTSEGELVNLIQDKAKSGVFLTVLGVGDDNLKDSTMQKLADKGNGNYAYLDSIDEARKVLVKQMNGTLITIAKDVKIQVEFNPKRVASYRLIGYEKRLLRKEDFNNDKVDAGEIGAGHTVTALYEVVPAGADPNPAASVPPVDPLKYQRSSAVQDSAPSADSNEMLTVKLRQKAPDGDQSELTERALVDDGARFENASNDFKFAAAVAEFGMILRNSEHKGGGNFGAVIDWAQQGKGEDAEGYRAGFIDLVRKARALKHG